MTVKTGITWTGLIVTKDATGALSAATVGPVGTLYVNGVANAAAVAIAGANPYSWSVVLPALAAGNRVSMYITATVNLIATAAVVAEESADTELVSDLNDPTAAAIQALVAAGTVAGVVGNVTGNVGGNVTGSVGSVAGNVAGNVAGSVGSVVGLTNVTISDQVWDEAIAGHLNPGSTGEKLNAAGGAGDPWLTPLPGAYAAGTAGNILGNLLASFTASAAFLAAIAGAVWTWGTRTLTSLATYLIGSIREYMGINISLEFCQGESPLITAVIEQQGGGVFDITGYTVVWWLTATRGGPALIVRSTTLGNLTIIDPTHGGIQFSLTSAETAALAAQTYYHECHIKAPAPSLREYCAFHGRCTVTESSIGAI